MTDADPDTHLRLVRLFKRANLARYEDNLELLEADAEQFAASIEAAGVEAQVLATFTARTAR